MHNNTFNNFVLDLLNFKKDPIVLEKKLDVLREEYFIEKQKLEEQKLQFQQKHEQPRKDYELALQEYLANLTHLRSVYQKNPTLKGHLKNWLQESGNVPEILRTKPSSVYSYLP